jgi:L-fuculose-phosphate aldolase
MREWDIRAEMVEVGRRLYARGLISGNEGNFSVRDAEVLYVTPAGVCKGFLTTEMIVKTDLSGRKLAGDRRVSTEVRMHSAVYSRRSDVGAVVHAHPPTATAFAVAGIPLDQPLIAESVVVLGRVPVVPYGTPSTADLSANVAEAICAAHALLLANHGALAVGESLYRAWERMETLEQLARIALASRQLGQPRALPQAEVERLDRMRAASGYPPPACVECPSCGGSVSLAGGDSVVLSRDELLRLLTEAVERFSRREHN